MSYDGWDLLFISLGEFMTEALAVASTTEIILLVAWVVLTLMVFVVMGFMVRSIVRNNRENKRREQAQREDSQ